MRIGALEAGGTKMVLAVGDESGKIFEQTQIPTKTPLETVPAMIRWFADKEIETLGIGCFGPVDVNKDSETYGSLLNTPKLAWKNFNILRALNEGMEDESGEFVKGLHLPMKIDTDVNGSCLGEMTYGSAKGIDSVVYITIGTGVGAGIAIDGKLVHGMLHPEAGHILLERHPGDPGKCICPSHENCFEGLACGPSIEKRWGQKGFLLADKKEVWELESYYIAQAIVGYMAVLSPKKIILGGGVMHQENLLELVKEKVKKFFGNYIETKELKDWDNYIVLNSLNDDQGILGALELGKQAYHENK